ncbi:MAG: SGNH/GDSL hydrolase family protein [Anaerolineaceae bacterium]|nr:SGNH/GDSL hydrolase family protein [Anaerolineaceae bacterium]
MNVQPNQKFVMIGDSITDCDRARPVGEGSFGALGNGYVSLVDGLLMARYPAHGIRVVNMGISGNTVRDLQGRWQSDVLDLQPDWLSIFIGINDVWRHFDTPLQPDSQVSLEEYSRTLDGLLQTTRPALKGLVLMTPYVLEPNRADGMRAMMDQYGAVVRQFAVTYRALLVDTQAAFDAVLQHLHPLDLSADRVHPTLAGHMVIARAFLQAVGFAWE